MSSPRICASEDSTSVTCPRTMDATSQALEVPFRKWVGKAFSQAAHMQTLTPWICFPFLLPKEPTI